MVTTLLSDELICRLCEKWKNIIMNLVKIFDDIHGTCLNYFIRLRHTDALQLDACLILDLLDKHFSFTCIEGDTGTLISGSCCTTTSVDVGLSLFWRLNLDYKVDIRNVKTS